MHHPARIGLAAILIGLALVLPSPAHPPPDAPTDGALCFGATVAADPVATRLVLTGSAALRMAGALALATRVPMPAATAVEAAIPPTAGPVVIRMILANGRCPVLQISPGLWLRALELLGAGF